MGRNDADRQEYRFTHTAGLIFAGFLLAGYFKGDPRLAWLPVDLTLVLAMGSAVLMIYRIVKKPNIPLTALWIYVLFMAFAIPILWTPMAGYSLEKVLRLYTFTLLSIVAPLILFRTDRDAIGFMNALTIYGCILAADGVYTLATNDALVRLTAFGSGTIALGRGVGFALLWSVLWSMEQKAPTWMTVGVTALTGVALVASGSRGPLFAAVVILVTLLPVLYRTRMKSLLVYVAIVTSIGLAFPYVWALAPKGSAARIERLIQGQLRESELYRIEAFSESIPIIASNPQGIGWGGYAMRFSPWGTAERYYPHNIVMETFLEGGWIAGSILVVMVGCVLVRLWRSRDRFAVKGVLVLVLFTLANALVSGDINDNRMLFAALGVALAVTSQRSAVTRNPLPGSCEVGVGKVRVR